MLVKMLPNIFIVLLLAWITKGQESNEPNVLKPFYLEEILKGAFRGRTWNGTWISDDVFLYRHTNGDYYKVNATNLEEELIIKGIDLKMYPYQTLNLSPDLSYILMSYGNGEVSQSQYIYSRYSIFDIKNKKFYYIANKKKLYVAHWAHVGHKLVYVLDGNVYYLTNPESVTEPVQITEDGMPNIIVNGFGGNYYGGGLLFGRVIKFSPDGKTFIFPSYNYSEVKEYPITIYGKPADITNQYTRVINFKYAKAGTPLASTSVYVVNLEDDDKSFNISEIPLPTPNTAIEPSLLIGLKWENNCSFSYTLINRVRNVSITNVFDKNNLSVIKTVEIKLDAGARKDGRGWLEERLPRFSEDLTKYYIISYQPEGNDTYDHLILVEDGKPKRLTKGKRVVISTHGWDKTRNLIFYKSTEEGNPFNMQTYVFDLETGTDKCLTCGFETPEGPCKFSETVFSKNFGYFAKICLGPGPHVIHIQHLESKNISVWQENRNLRDKLSKKLKPTVKDVLIKLECGYSALVRMVLPPYLDEESKKKYPMVVNVYSGPLPFSRIDNKYVTDLVDYFTTNRNYIYTYIEGRGYPFTGNNMKFEIHERLGTVELDDQIEVLKKLLKKFPFIDADRIGLWGGSYGGFATVGILIKDTENLFKFGFAACSVTNFANYQTIYTEKYLGTLESNLKGYINTDWTRNVEALRNKTLFLAHGTSDTNVHFQHAMLLAKALQNANIMFYQQDYPDLFHNLRMSSHFCYAMDWFFDQQFSPDKKTK